MQKYMSINFYEFLHDLDFLCSLKSVAKLIDLILQINSKGQVDK